MNLMLATWTKRFSARVLKTAAAAIVPAVCSATMSATPIPWAGGPVVQNVRIISIYWGTPDSQLRASMDRFYTQIAGSGYLSRLSEYSTGAVVPTLSPFRAWFGNPTEQIVGTGEFAGSYVIQQIPGGNVETTDIGPQLDHEIHVGHIPGPDRNTIYMVHFSADWRVYLGSNFLGIPIGSAAGDGFCAYHAAYYSDYTNRAIVYAALPNQATIAGCQGYGSTLDAETLEASHELVEAITDPGSAMIEGGFLKVGIESGDQAWRTENGFLGLDPSEIADRCAQGGPDGDGGFRLRTSPDARDNYYVALSWSNVKSACLVSGPIGSLDQVQADAFGVTHVLGWTLDPENEYNVIQAHIYFDGPYPFGRGYAVVANKPRGDVNAGTGYAGSHGFDFVVPDELRDGKTHAVYAYGIGVSPGNNAFLGNVPLTFNSTLRTQSALTSTLLASAMAGGQCMDVVNASRLPGAAIQLFTCDGAENQQFSYHADTREIRAFNDSSLCLNQSGIGGGRVTIWPCNGAANQKWTFNLDDGEIRGANVACMDASGSSVANGTVIQMVACNHHQNQSWFRK